ncbi:MAG TPA: DUF2169 domain-containing protein, partial [Polyangiaceae bacterium]|nr:DUF2169 domain-containing protein [Polyangiaceae bacterium]
AEDMDGTYFNAAPPDQQLDGYLRGDEEIVLTNMHPTAKRLTTTLPGKRVRVFVRDVQAQIREIEMRLDTLFIDVDDASLYLTWRGITPVEEEDLTDVEFGLVVSEPLDGRRAPPKPYHEQLERFAADPVGVKDAFPTGFMEFADEAQKLEDADDAELEALLQSDDGDGALTAGLKNLFGPMTPPGLEKVDAGIAKAAEHDDVDGDAINAELGAAVTAAVSEGGSGGVGLRLPLRDGEEPIFPIGTLFRAQERRLVELKKKLPDDAPPEAAQQIDTVLDQIRTNPELLAADPHYEPYAEDDPPPDEPGPGADLLGRDLSGMDLSGRDLSGADIQCAVLHKTNLRGANLAGAKLGGARLSKTELSDANLSDVDLTSASFDGVVAQRTNLTRARLDLFRASRSDFSEAYLSETVGMLATFNESRFERTDFAQARLMLCSYDGCSMGGCRFHEAKLDHVRFDGCDAAGLVLERAELVGASFNRCQLSEAAATGITGQGAVWFETGLQRATFHKADLQASFFFAVDALEADFSRANVPLARFDRAVLRKANFERANLLKATLRKAVVSKTCFRRASLYEAQLTEAAGNDVDVEGADMTGVNVQRSKITLTGRTRS